MEVTRNHLLRFVKAQQETYEAALAEVKNGSKAGHWMWFIFPQLKGLGHSETSRFYAITNKEEAVQYLNHPVLGTRLIEISEELLKLQTTDAVQIFGSVDALKLKSSMTLFSLAGLSYKVFHSVLDKFFGGERGKNTLQLLSNDN